MVHPTRGLLYTLPVMAIAVVVEGRPLHSQDDERRLKDSSSRNHVDPALVPLLAEKGAVVFKARDTSTEPEPEPLLMQAPAGSSSASAKHKRSWSPTEASPSKKKKWWSRKKKVFGAVAGAVAGAALIGAAALTTGRYTAPKSNVPFASKPGSGGAGGWFAGAKDASAPVPVVVTPVSTTDSRAQTLPMEIAAPVSLDAGRGSVAEFIAESIPSSQHGPHAYSMAIVDAGCVNCQRVEDMIKDVDELAEEHHRFRGKGE